MRRAFPVRARPRAALLRAGATVLALSLLAGPLAGCSAVAADPSSGEAAGNKNSHVTLPPPGGQPDYQLGGAYEPAADVTIVARDRGAEPAPGRYSICYVNGFQTQPGEIELFPNDALLRAADGGLRMDPDWPDEALLDTSRATTRAQITAVVGPWIEKCGRDGFDAVEFDNLDTYTRSDGALSRADNLALAAEYVRIAHAAGLAAGQKNAAEDAARLRDEAGFDFAVTEECLVFRECGAYTSVYGEHVIDIEYTDALPRSFAEMCRDAAAPASLVLRDRLLATPGAPEYTFARCGD